MRPHGWLRRVVWLLVGLTFGMPALADGKPLTLDDALAYASRPNPDLDAARARTELARAGQALIESQQDFRVTLDSSLDTGRNPTLGGYAPNNFASLDIRRTLWDGGRTEFAAAAAELDTKGREYQYLDVVAQRRLTIMTRFFDVLLTDMQYTVDSELTAAAYVDFDNGRDRRQVGELSSADLARLEDRYQNARLKREDDLRRARVKRALLADAMNRPGDLPSDLARPVLKGNDRTLPPLNELVKAMEAGNPRLAAERRFLAAARRRLDAARADDRPSVALDAGTATYSRNTLSRDDVHFGIDLTWPLFRGRENDALAAQAHAQIERLQAQLKHEVQRVHKEYRRDLVVVREERLPDRR